MKSHQYASKRRLTNICCLVVSLAFIKLAFAAYVMAGGELFEFTSEKKKISPKAAIIAREQDQRRMNNGSQNTLSNNSGSSLAGQHMNVSGIVKSNAPMSNSRVSFLPKGQKNDKNNVSTVQTPDRVPAQIQAQAQVSGHVVASASTTQIDRSSMISDDAILAQASAVTANIARAQMRNNLLQSAFAENTEDNFVALAGIEKQESNYVSANPASGAPAEGEQTNKPKEKSSFFSFVGTANAAEEPYIRPDEKTTAVIPAPTVGPYSSPESLEYQKSELNRKEEELLALQQQMSARMDELNKIEGRIDTMVKGANTRQDDQIQHLVDTYTSMKAKKAAETLTTLDEAIAVRILNGMKGKQSGEIFSYMDSAQAARLSEAMTKLQM